MLPSFRSRHAVVRRRCRYLTVFCRVLLLTVLPGLDATPAAAQAADDAAFGEAVGALNASNFRQKAAAIDALAALEHPRVGTVLEAMLNGDLYYRKSDRRLVTVSDAGGALALRDAVSGDDLGAAGKRDVKRISVNNSLRSQIRGVLARLRLGADDPAVRLAAVRQMLDDFGPENAEMLRRRVAGETDPAVREAMQTGVAIGALSSDAPADRLEAIASLGDTLNPEVLSRLRALGSDDPDGQVRDAAAAAIAAASARRQAYQRVETLFFGLSLGSVLFLAAVGLAITFGVMGVINMAHGELIMLGAYTTYLVQAALPGAIDYSLFIAIPLAFLVSGLFGIAIERGVIRFLYGRPLETLLATFGISLMLQQMVRSGISAQNVPVANPDWMSGSWQINAALSLTYNRLYIFVFALLVFFALLLILKRTALGLQVRAVAQNRAMARAMGVRTGRVDALTFGLGAGIAGVAGVALSQLTNVGPNLGQAYIVDSFLVVVFGGVGNVFGTLLGALGLGVLNKFLEPEFGAVLAKILVLVGIILFIQKRPRGLFPQRGRAAEG